MTDMTGAQLSTYRMGGLVDELYAPNNLDDVRTFCQRLRTTQRPLTTIGWGGNIIIAKQGIRGATLWTRKLDWVEQGSPTTFTLGAGCHLAKVSKLAADNGLTGGEFFIGIPGTIGGAVRMNAGALGQQTSDVVREVTLFDRDTQQIHTWPVEKLAYRYRHSAINPARHVVLQVVVQFKRASNSGQVKQAMADSVHFRKTHHPIEPNGGSVFRNPTPTEERPEPWPVGKMLDSLGAKTWVEGNVRISPRHANFIINTGGGTSTEVLTLMTRMKTAVWDAFGLTVVPENILIGDVTAEEAKLWRNLTTPPKTMGIESVG